MVEIIAHRLGIKAEEKRRRYQGRTPGQFTPLLISSGGVWEKEMLQAWQTWAKADLRFWPKLVAKMSCILIEYKAHAYIWIT